MSISQLTTEHIEASINEDLETLLDLKEEIQTILQAINLEINDALTYQNKSLEKILDKEWLLHFKLLQEVENSISRVNYIIK